MRTCYSRDDVLLYIFLRQLLKLLPPEYYSAHPWYQKNRDQQNLEPAPDLNPFLKYSAQTKSRICNNRDQKNSYVES